MLEQRQQKLASNKQRHAKLSRIRRLLRWCLEHWILLFSLLFAVMNLLPFIAPIFMQLGWTAAARVIYIIYSPLCHQMAQRSFFLFGEQAMHNIAELPVSISGNTVSDMVALRSFIGNPDLGWKVAWSDRMVYMYGTVLLAAIFFGLLRHHRRLHPPRFGMVALLLMPLAVDGTSHLLSDINGGLLEGFRYANPWLADWTGHLLPGWFYQGDAIGSFNSWMRLISGIGFGFACVWFAFPYLDRSISLTLAELSSETSQVQNMSPMQTFDEGSAS